MKISAVLREIDVNVESQTTLLDLPLVQVMTDEKDEKYLLIEHFGMYEKFMIVKFKDDHEYDEFLKDQSTFKKTFKEHKIWYINTNKDQYFYLVNDEAFLNDLKSYVDARRLTPIT